MHCGLTFMVAVIGLGGHKEVPDEPTDMSHQVALSRIAIFQFCPQHNISARYQVTSNPVHRSATAATVGGRC